MPESNCLNGCRVLVFAHSIEKLYTYVGNDPMDRTDPKGLAGCGNLGKDQCASAMAAQASALADVKAARASISELKSERAEIKAGDRSELSAGASATEKQLNSYFKGSGDSVLSKVDGMLGHAESVLSDSGGNYNYVSAPSEKAANGRASLAWTSFMSSKIRLTPEFFGNPGQQERSLVHEPTHIFGTNLWSDETYGDSAVRQLNGRQALDNADSYAQFVIHQ